MRILLVPLLRAVLAAGCDRAAPTAATGSRATRPSTSMLVSAEGFEPVASNRYHPEGRAAGRFDVLLTPARS